MGAHFCSFKKTKDRTIQLTTIYGLNIHASIYKIHSRFFLSNTCKFLPSPENLPRGTSVQLNDSTQLACLCRYAGCHGIANRLPCLNGRTQALCKLHTKSKIWNKHTVAVWMYQACLSLLPILGTAAHFVTGCNSYLSCCSRQNWAEWTICPQRNSCCLFPLICFSYKSLSISQCSPHSLFPCSHSFLHTWKSESSMKINQKLWLLTPSQNS